MFIVGLTIDIFSNTPGLHASASTTLMLVRDFWLRNIFHKWMLDDGRIKKGKQEKISKKIPIDKIGTSIRNAKPLLLLRDILPH